jgi:hypothetical protein
MNPLKVKLKAFNYPGKKKIRRETVEFYIFI